MSEYFPDSDRMLEVGRLRSEVDGVIAGETDPVRQAFLLITTLQAGDPRLANDGQVFDALDGIHAADPSIGSSNAGYGLLDQTAKGVAELHRRGYDVEHSADQLMRYAATTCGEDSDRFWMTGNTLLGSGYVDPTGALSQLITAEHFLSHNTTTPRIYRTHDAQKFLQVLVANHGIDVIAESSPYRKLCENIWEIQDMDPDFYGHTFYLSQAYAQVGNTSRAHELASELHGTSQRCKALLAVAETCTDNTLREELETEADQHARKDPQYNGLSLEMAEYFARMGDSQKTREWLAVPSSYAPHLQADAWANLYLHSGGIDDRNRCVDLWHEGFNDSRGQAELVRSVAVKDYQTGRLKPSFEPTAIPLMAYELVTADRGRLAWNRGRPLALLAEQFASDGNAEALAVVLPAIRSSYDTMAKVRGLSAAAVGLIAA